MTSKNIFYYLLGVVGCFILNTSHSSNREFLGLGSGEVSVLGSIVTSACAIDTSSKDQTIYFGVIPINQIARYGKSDMKNFSVRLVNCVLPEKSEDAFAQLTFEGENNGDFFAVKGEAKGIALKLSDHMGNEAIPGIPMPKINLLNTDMSLNYSVFLVSDNNRLKAGDFNSIIKFKMNYY